jgi:hypothetical protein
LRGERHPGRGESLSTGVVTLLLTAGIVRQLAAGRRCRFKGSTCTNKAWLKTYEVLLVNYEIAEVMKFFSPRRLVHD